MYEINIVEKFTNLHIILYSSQDPFENSLGTDTDPTIYFVPDTCAQHKRKKRLRPNTIIEETVFSSDHSSPTSIDISKS